MLGITCTQTKGQGSALKNEPVLKNDSIGTYVTVESGYTAYDISSYYYGDGESWRWIVLNNPFLQEKGRVWQVATSKKWYCRILPGEKLYLPSIPNLPQVVESKKDTVSVIPTLAPENVSMGKYSKIVNWVIFSWLIIGMIYILLLLFKQRKRDVDPISAGPPQVLGGINDEQVFGRYKNYAHHRFPNAKNIVVKNIRKGTLSGPAIVHYGDSTTKKINLRNIPGYAGEILVDNKEYTVYFLQGCGNDARAGNFMTGKELVFTLEKELPDPKEKLVDLPVAATKDEPNLQDPSSDSKEGESKKESGEELPSEEAVNKFLSIVEKAIDANGQSHKIMLEMSNAGELRFSLEPRFNKQEQPKKTGEGIE